MQNLNHNLLNKIYKEIIKNEVYEVILDCPNRQYNHLYKIYEKGCHIYWSEESAIDFILSIYDNIISDEIMREIYFMGIYYSTHTDNIYYFNIQEFNDIFYQKNGEKYNKKILYDNIGNEYLSRKRDEILSSLKQDNRCCFKDSNYFTIKLSKIG